jgi:cytochrome c-type biogenesis protein CcmH/NrfG
MTPRPRPSIQGYTKPEWQKVKRALRLALRLPPGPALLQRAVLLLELAVRDHPNEWAYWYALGDYYQRLDDWTSSIRVCHQCYKLRPQDPRSAYALATAFRFSAEQHAVSDAEGHKLAKAALALFLQVLDAPIPKRERRFVQQHLEAMATRYPALDAQ